MGHSANICVVRFWSWHSVANPVIRIHSRELGFCATICTFGLARSCLCAWLKLLVARYKSPSTSITAPNGLPAGLSPLIVSTKNDPHCFKKSYALLIKISFCLVSIPFIVGKSVYFCVERARLGRKSCIFLVICLSMDVQKRRMRCNRGNIAIGFTTFLVENRISILLQSSGWQKIQWAVHYFFSTCLMIQHWVRLGRTFNISKRGLRLML